MEYTVYRSDRKTMALEITVAGDLRVRAPYWVPQEDIDRFVQDHDTWIAKHLQIQRERAANMPPDDPEEEARLRALAAQILPQRVAVFAAQMGVMPTGVKITGAKKRFGSCNGTGGLCFAYRLMAYPPEAVDYVVVHELAHIRHHDHSPQFYRFVASVLPDYRERENLLRK